MKRVEEKTLHPIGLQKFVTFSSWNLLGNFTYFLIATLLASSVLFEFSLPTWPAHFSSPLLCNCARLSISNINDCSLCDPAWRTSARKES